jgi:hypothetical protein
MPEPMQRERRRDPYPWTWEPPAAAALGVLLVALVGIQLGRSLANLLAGAGWTWPDLDAGGGLSSPLGTAFWTSLSGVVTGDAAAGLPGPTPTDVVGPRLLWGSIAVTELALLAVVGWAVAYIYQRWGPGRMRGMATAEEAEKILGVTRLRNLAPIVRPDLYGKHAPDPQPVRRDAGDPDEHPGTPPGSGLSPWLLGRHTSTETR